MCFISIEQLFIKWISLWYFVHVYTLVWSYPSPHDCLLSPPTPYWFPSFSQLIPLLFSCLYFFLGDPMSFIRVAYRSMCTLNLFLLRAPVLWVRANPGNFFITSLPLTWPHHGITVCNTGVRGWIFRVSNCVTCESNTAFSMCSPEPMVEGRFVTSLSSIHNVRDGLCDSLGCLKKFPLFLVF